MKYHSIAMLILISSFAFAEGGKPLVGRPGEVFALNKEYKIAKVTDKGFLLVNSQTCDLKVYRQNVYISVVNNNFNIELPDGRTVIGSVEDADESNGKPACFHSLSAKPSGKQPENWMVFASHTDLGGKNPDGLVNCKNRNGGTVTDAIKYLPKKEYTSNCFSDLGCRKTERAIRIKAGSGLTFYQLNEKQRQIVQKGSNVTRADLKADESTLKLCSPTEETAPQPKPKTEPNRST